ncbi:MAG: fibronectin type III domain-containing protein [Candidatus Micrarchaeota archaeon]
MTNVRLLVFGLLAAILLAGCVQGPGNVTASPVAGGIQLDWAPVSNSIGYDVYRSTQSGVEGAKVNGARIVGTTTYTDTSVSNGNTYYYTIKSVDAGGAATPSQQASAIARTNPPSSLHIGINGGAQYTAEKSVALTLSAQAATQCQFSNDANVWSNWEPYATSKQWQLTDGDGEKEVYYQCKDEIGNVAQPTSASIALDTVPPVVTITSPAANQQYGTTVDVVFSVADNIAATLTCTGKLDGVTADSGVVDRGQPVTVTGTASVGPHTLVIECDDGLLKGSSSVSFSVTDKPTVAFTIGDNSGYTSSVNVLLKVTATQAKDCRFSNDGSTWGGWNSYTQQVQWTLTSSEGNKNIYGQCRNANGVTSDTVSTAVVLDTSPPPYISIRINNDATWTNNQNVYLGLYAFAASQCRYSNDGTSWSDWSQYATSKTWTLSSGEGMKRVYYNCKKSTGEDIGTASDYIKYSQVEPNPPSDMSITINNGDDHTSNRNLRLQLYARGASDCRFQENDNGWMDWEDYTTSKTFVVTQAGGRKDIYYQCRNDYGSNIVHASIYYDTSPPSRITNLGATAGTNSISLRWSRPSDQGTGISYYNIYRSTRSTSWTRIDTSSSTTYTDYNVQGGETYSYNVRAVDSTGNEAPDSNIVSATVKGQTTITVRIFYPTSGATTQAPVDLQFQVDDSTYPVASCLYVVNHGTPSPSSQYNTGMESSTSLGIEPPTEKRQFTVSVTCRDAGNNYASSPTVSFYVEPLVGPLT